MAQICLWHGSSTRSGHDIGSKTLEAVFRFELSPSILSLCQRFPSTKFLDSRRFLEPRMVPKYEFEEAGLGSFRDRFFIPSV